MEASVIVVNAAVVVGSPNVVGGIGCVDGTAAGILVMTVDKPNAGDDDVFITAGDGGVAVVSEVVVPDIRYVTYAEAEEGGVSSSVDVDMVCQLMETEIGAADEEVGNCMGAMELAGAITGSVLVACCILDIEDRTRLVPVVGGVTVDVGAGPISAVIEPS